jgi:AraC family transcriptional regulator, L-rhamnose operon transcriptional activator RhaR
LNSQQDIRPHYAWHNTFDLQEQPIAARQWSCSGDFPRHDHDFYEINLVLSGQAHHSCANGQTLLQRGDLVLLRPGSWHSYQGCRNLKGVFCAFSESMICHDLAWTLEDPALAGLLWKKHKSGVIPLRLPPNRFVPCRNHFISLCGSIQTRGSFARRLSLLLMIFSEMAETLLETESDQNSRFTQSHPAVHKAIRHMEEDLSHAWSTEGLAREFDLEPSYFGRVFRRVTGFTPMTFLENRRLERAATLLRSGVLSIGEIGEAIGLLNHAYFSHRFKKRWKLSPSDYRKNRHRSEGSPV